MAGIALRDGTSLQPERAVRLAGPEAAALRAADDGTVMIRPEHVALDSSEGGIACRVQRIQLLAGLIRYTVRSDA